MCMIKYFDNYGHYPMFISSDINFIVTDIILGRFPFLGF